MAGRDTDLTGQVLARRFRVRRTVASGGIATIYEVEHVVTRRLGALKLLKPPYAASAEAVERLSREASAASRIASSHVVETLDAGRLDSGEPYVFMELLAGESLDVLLASRGRLPFPHAIDIISQAAQGLEATHGAGIVHRDIKPANLFVLSQPKGFVKILDFGISKFSAFGLESLTREGRALGTFLYMPPEQMAGAKHVGIRADVYSLAIVLYECVVGKVPFNAKSIPELAAGMASGEYTPPSRIRADAPPGFDALIARCLVPDPAQRCADMGELLGMLAAVQKRSSVSQTLAVGAGAALSPLAAVSRRAEPIVREAPEKQSGIETIQPESTKRRG